MFFGQLLKILLFAAFLYLIFNLVVYIFRILRIVRAKRKEEERKFGDTRKDPSGKSNGKEVIEIDKDHYKVE
jgi:hypothetical protein